MKEKLKAHWSEDTMDLVYHIIDWLYFQPTSKYDMFPYSKTELRMALEGMRVKKISEKIHSENLKKETM